MPDEHDEEVGAETQHYKSSAEIPQNVSEKQEEPKKIHFHKSMSSIFGHSPIFKNAPEAGQDADDESKHESAPKTRISGFLFKTLAFALLCLSVFLYFKAQKEAAARFEIEGKLTNASAQLNVLQVSMNEIKADTEKIDSYKNEIKELKSEAATLSIDLQKTAEENVKLQKGASEKEKKIAELNNKLKASKFKSTGFRDVFMATPVLEGAPPGQDAKMGRILVVRPVSKLAAINLGTNDGITKGAVFDIYHLNGTYLGALVIDEVTDTVSIGCISPDEVAGKIRENYIVKLR